MGHSTNGWFLHSASLLFPGSRYEFSSSLRENRVKIRASKHVQQVVSKLYNDAVHRFNMHSEMTRRLQMRFSANCLHEHQFAKIPEAFRALFVKWVPRSALCTSRPSLMPDVLRIIWSYQERLYIGRSLAADALNHYVECEPLWSCIYLLLQLPPPVRPFDKLGLGSEPPGHCFFPLAVAFDVCNKAKTGFGILEQLVSASIRALRSQYSQLVVPRFEA
jgi:hypothetical protein